MKSFIMKEKFKVPIILFLIALFLNVYGIWWGLPNYYTWSTDDLTPTTPLLMAKNHFVINSEYPVFHFFLLDVVYSPYLAYLYFSSGLINPHQGFPYGFTDPLTSLTVLLFLSRLVSAFMGAFAVVFVYLSVKTLYGRKAALFSALCVSFSYTFILFSHLGNLDIPSIFWFTIALYSYSKLIKTYKLRYYILLGIFTALAASTKDQIVGFFVLLPLPLLWLHYKHHIGKVGLKNTIFNKKLLYCFLALSATYVLATNMIFNFSGYIFRLNWWSSNNLERWAQFPSTIIGQLHLFLDTILKLKYSVGIALFILLLAGFIYCLYKFNSYTFAFLIPLISYYIFDIARIHYLYYRMTIPIIIVLSFFAGKFLSDIIKKLNYKKIIYLIIFIIFIYTFLYGFSADLTLAYDSRHSAEDWMINNIKKDANIEVYNDGKYLPRFHALGYENVSMVLFNYKDEGNPPILLFKPVIDSASLESLKKRNPDYIFFPGCCYDISGYSKEKQDYLNILLSEKAGYKIVKVFDNKIPFAPETPFMYKRTNIPVIILKKV